MFVLDRSQRARVQKYPRIVAAVMSLALLGTGLEAQQPAQAAPLADPQPAAKVESRLDLVSAVVTARSQGSKVEVESMRSETSSTWANPDGTMTTEAHAAPIRFKAANDSWQPIDLTLARGTDGMVAPRGHKLGLRLGKRNATTGGVFASAVAGSGRQVEWLAPFKLPEPTIDGTKATYAEVQPGVDLTLDARRSGFETDFSIKRRPGTAPVWRIPLRTQGLTARTATDGTIEFVDARNVVRSRTPVAYMWDSVADPATKDPVNKAIVNVTVEEVSPGKATLVIAPDAKWFLDPARVFPVTVDPTYANTPVYSSFDTFVQSGWPSDLSTTVDLRVGKNGTTTERSFQNFAGATFQGKDITSASLFLYQYGAATCAATQMNLHAALPASNSTRWTSQPVTSQQVWGSVSAAKGFSGACPGERIAMPMTGLAQYWSGTTDATVGVALKAANEADANAWKRFVSSEGDADPYISLTWNRPPNEPAVVETTEAVAYAAPGETASSMYTANLKPWVRTKATDPDGNTVKYVYEFHTTPVNDTSLKGTCTSSVYASGTTAGCRPGTDLPDNTQLYVRAKANDGRRDGPWTGYWMRLRTGAAKPAAPQVVCPAPYADGTWQDNEPTTDVVCTVTATGIGYNAPGYIRITVDGKPVTSNTGVAGQRKITPSSDPAVAKYEVTIKKDTPGLHRITAQAESPVGQLSDSASHSFGWGGSGITSPTVDPRVTTTDTIKIEASGPPKGQSTLPTAKVRWRVSGYGEGAFDTIGWNEDGAELPVADNGSAGVSVSTVWNSKNAATDAYLDSDPSTPQVEPTTLNDRVPVLLDIQVCFTYTSSTQCTWSQKPGTTIQRVPHAFGNGYPTGDAGPGEVALWTGEFSTEASDIEVPGYSGSLAVSRSHSTYAGPASVGNSVFGPGWVAQFDGADDGGAAGLEVIDSTLIDGTIALMSADGTGLVYSTSTGQRRTSASFAIGTWRPADDDTALDAGKLTVAGTGAATTLTYTSRDGVVTTFKVAAAPTASAGASFRTSAIAEPGLASETSYSYDAAGRVTRILAPTPPGVTCSASGALNSGCRALRFDYASISGSGVRMTGAWLDIYNPAKTGGAGMDSIKVASYTYDSAGRLAAVSDPRSNLATGYGYNASNHLTSVTPPGQTPVQLNYVVSEGRERLSTVTRQRPVGGPTGTATLARFIYDVPLSGAGLPDLTPATVGKWGQKSVPAKGFAVFGPDHPISGSPSADDWQYADLQYADASGYTVNNVEYGAGAWQYTAADYDDQGNVVRELGMRALRLALDDQLPAGATADQLSTQTVYNADIKNAAGETITPAGALVTDTYGPAKYAPLHDGTVRWVRSRTHTGYDHSAPNSGINPASTLPYRLETSEQGTAFDPGTGQDLEVVAGSITEYSALGTGEADGWALGQQTRSITDVDLDGLVSSGDQVHITKYDGEGRAIEDRQPVSAGGSGADAGTTRTVYYTAAVNAAFPSCGGKPAWAGLTCRTYPGAAPVSAAGQPATPSLPTTTFSDYNYLLSPAAMAETSGAVTRTTTTTYTADGKLRGGSTTVTGLANSTATTRKDTTFDLAMGLPRVAIALNADGSTAGTVTTGYDTWGRPISYQPSGEAATTTTYTAAGGISQIVDANGTTSFTYSGTDALGRTEPRTLVTKVDVATAGGTWTSTAAYDHDGAMTLQKLPGGVSQTTRLDHTGEVIGLEYNGQITVVNEDGSTTVNPDGAWLAWSRDNDVNGRLIHEWTPTGAAFTGAAGDSGPTDVGDAAPYDRAYSYDAAGRLTNVNDRTGSPGANILDPAQTSCITRTYGFDANDNRLTKATAASPIGAACNSTGATTVTRTFDTADRPTTGANGQGSYIYDLLGRTTTIPAADTPRPQDGDLSLAYYDNDLAKTITQAGASTAFALDALDRRATETTTTGSSSTQTVRHYTDASDNPTWITQGTTTQRYAELIGGDLALTVNQTGAGQLTLSNEHGDIVTTVDLPTATSTATAIAGWNDYDEYGVANTANTATTDAIKYGWLGAQQRATSGAGLQLMGVRLYNSATGLFSSTDPVAGGNTNDYTYPTDPINQFDLDGRMNRADQGGRSRGADYGGGPKKSDFQRSSRNASTYCCSSSGGYKFSQRHMNRMMDRFEKRIRSKTIRDKGKTGMRKAGAHTQNTQSVNSKGRKFIPDFWRGKTIGEVKYYRPGRTVYATRQIRGMANWARNNGHKFVLRVNRGVKLSSGIRALERQGKIIISRYG